MKQTNPEIVAFIERLADTGSHYRIDEMKALYTEDLGFLVLAAEGEIKRFSKGDILKEFSARREAGEPPLSTEKRILHIEERQDEAVAILYRRMRETSDALF